ncbi:MAG: hypothetical protein Q4D82_01075 [Neisseria sp.]|nr:hypothetical protein [Neisseria sp.]
MKHIIRIGLLTMTLTACSFGGFKPAPDASASWKLTNFTKLYPGLTAATLKQYPEEERRRQMHNYFDKKNKDMHDCSYDPIGGGGSEEDACLRKKGWYRVGADPYPENKQYEWPRTEN